jgi:hypothetical protein
LGNLGIEQFFENYKADQMFGLLLNEKSNVLILTKNGLGYILGGFFTKSSGHPASGQNT